MLINANFFEEKVEHLGHIISSEGLNKSPEKVKAIQNAARPRNGDELKFLGLVMHYTNFFRDASAVFRSLNEILRKDVIFN